MSRKGALLSCGRSRARTGLAWCDAGVPAGEDEAHVTIRLDGGVEYSTHVQATGSPDNPMTDAQLEAKFTALAAERLGPARAAQLLNAAWHLDAAPGLEALLALARGN